jgi:hypothetical protein
MVIFKPSLPGVTYPNEAGDGLALVENVYGCRHWLGSFELSAF